MPLSIPLGGSFSTEVTNAPPAAAAGEAPGESTDLIFIIRDFLSLCIQIPKRRVNEVR